MTPEEKALLADFLARLTAARDVAADGEANLMIARAAAQQPAALYLAIQRAVWLEHALQEAQTRISRLEAAQATPAGAAGNPWLSSTWGSGADNGRVSLPPTMAAVAPAPLPYAAPPQAGGPGYPAQGYSGNPGWQNSAAPGFGGFGGSPFGASPGFLGGGSSFLATAAATAAGVVAGELVADAFSRPHHSNQGMADLPPEADAGQSFSDSGSDAGGLGDFDSDS